MGIDHLYVHEDAFRLGIRHPAACLLRNVYITDNKTALEDDVTELMEVLTKHPTAILGQPEVEGFRALFSEMGYPNRIIPGHKLIDSLLREGFRPQNNLIDAWKIACAYFGSRLGIHDPATLQFDLNVWLSEGREEIAP